MLIWSFSIFLFFFFSNLTRVRFESHPRRRNLKAILKSLVTMAGRWTKLLLNSVLRLLLLLKVRKGFQRFCIDCWLANAVLNFADDLDIAPDFFEYFLGTYWLLKRDPTLWCVSAWNDNGKNELVDHKHPELLYRTDFFPGLGWMLTSEFSFELNEWSEKFHSLSLYIAKWNIHTLNLSCEQLWF